MHLTVFTR